MLIKSISQSQNFMIFCKKIIPRKKNTNFYLVIEKKVLPLYRF